MASVERPSLCCPTQNDPFPQGLKTVPNASLCKYQALMSFPFLRYRLSPSPVSVSGYCLR